METFDIYTRDGKYLGVKSETLCHRENPGFYHKPVWIWIINDKNEILVQKRASQKTNYPGFWDMSVAGHVNAGEISIDGAIRETYEEIGIKTSFKDYEFICEYISDSSFEIAMVYLLKLNINLKDFKLQKEEVSEVRWLSYETFKQLFYSDKFVPFEDEYRKLVLNTLKNYIN